MSDWTVEFEGLVLGPEGTGYDVYDVLPEEEITVKDAPRSGADGRRFGRDTRDGTTVTLDLGVKGDGPTGEVLDRVSVLRAKWRGDRVRQSPGSVTTLRLTRPGRDVVLFGRPRKLAPKEHTNVAAGYVPYQAEFVGSDDVFYSYEETASSVVIRPAGVGGFSVPATAPWGAAQAAPANTNQLVVEGDLATWLVFDVHGPLSSPTIEVFDRFIISMPGVSIGDGRVLTIDPRPWVRSVKDDEGARFTGKFSATSPKLSDLKVAPGTHIVRLGGTDVTGTASVVIRHRDAYAGF